jgi:hypothetical protein
VTLAETSAAFASDNFSGASAVATTGFFRVGEVVAKNPSVTDAFARPTLVGGKSLALALVAWRFLVGDIDDSDLKPSTFAFAAGGCVGHITIPVTIRAEQSTLIFTECPSLALALTAFFALRGLGLTAAAASFAKFLV